MKTRSLPVRAVLSAALGLLLLTTSSRGSPQWAPLVMALALLAGLPHGALDHQVAAQRWAAWRGGWGQVAFHGTYLMLSAMVVLLWWLVPMAALLLFLAASAWHFGESDLLHLPERSTSAVISRGLLLIAAPLLAWPETSSASLSGLGHGVAVAMPQEVGMLLALSIAVLHQWHMQGAPDTDRYAALALSVLLIGGGPLFGLGLYFCLWHTPDHFRQLARTLSCNPGHLARAALPRTLGAAVLLVIGAWLTAPAHWLTVIIQLTAALTIPHALVVHFGWSPQETSPSMVAAE